MIRITLTAFTLVLVLSSCQERQSELPSTLRIAVLPDQSNNKLVEQYEPLVNHLRAELKLDIKVIKAQDYEELLNLFITNQIDLANFGALTYLRAKSKRPVNAIVMRDIDARFTSYFIVHKDQAYNNLIETTGTSLMFGAELSTSGHLMPRYFLAQQNIVPESFYRSVSYSGKHDKTVELVANKQADVGALNAPLYDRLINEGNNFALETRVVWETPPYTDYMWTLQSHFSLNAAHKIRDAFLSLSYNNPAHQRILDNLGTNGYIPVTEQNLTEINNFAKSLALIE